MKNLLCLLVLAASPCFAAEIEFKEAVEYGTGGDDKLTLHLAYPKEIDGTRPGIIFIHGGGWAAGNKDVHKQHIKEAAEKGYIAVSVGYRLAPKNPFPAQIEDVKCCVRWMRAHAEELKLDPKRIGAIGFSAGAHLSMILGTMDEGDGLEGEGGWADQSSKVQCVVAYFGPTDLTQEFPETSRNILKNFLNGTKEEKLEDYKKASPIMYVNEGDAPTLIFQGTEDVLVPYQQAFLFTDALTKAKVKGRIELMVGANHGWGGKELERTVEGTYDFFQEHLKP